MTKKIVQVKKRREVIWENKAPRIKLNERTAGSYVVKSKYAVLNEQINQKKMEPKMEFLSEKRESGLSRIGKALQQKEKYVKKGTPYMVKKDIGARF